MTVIGTINGEGRDILIDSLAIKKKYEYSGIPSPSPAVDLELEKVLGDMPQKSFEFHRITDAREPLDIAPGITVMDSLKRVLRLPSVCSKCFLTSKVDKCVTCLVAQQQTVGPLQIHLSVVAVIAQTFTDVTGGACAIGKQPIKAKLDGDGPAMYDAVTDLSVAMIELGIAIDGGKDNLSMAAHVAGEVVKAPGNLVMSVYCTCPDIEDVPYLKRVFEGVQDLLSNKLISRMGVLESFDQWE
ncbi:hypothetical protein ACFX13_042034 [Malus domestica]